MPGSASPWVFHLFSYSRAMVINRQLCLSRKIRLDPNDSSQQFAQQSVVYLDSCGTRDIGGCGEISQMEPPVQALPVDLADHLPKTQTLIVFEGVTYVNSLSKPGIRKSCRRFTWCSTYFLSFINLEFVHRFLASIFVYFTFHLIHSHFQYAWTNLLLLRAGRFCCNGMDIPYG
jgi:hypothetical protein